MVCCICFIESPIGLLNLLQKKQGCAPYENTPLHDLHEQIS